MNVEKMMRKDSSGIATLLIVVIVAVILIVAAGAAYIVLSGNDNDNGTDEPQVKQIFAPGTVMTYTLSVPGNPTGELKMEYIGQSADEYFIKQTTTLGLSGTFGYTTDYKALPSSAVKKGTTELDTIDGKKTVDIWEYTDPMGTSGTAYIDPASNIMYRGISDMGGSTATYTLESKDIKWQAENAYKESQSIGMTYNYSGTAIGISGTYTGKIECAADCTGGQYGVKYILGGDPTCFLSNHPQGLPADAVNTGTTTTIPTLTDKTLQVWKYESTGGDTTFYYDPVSHIVYGFDVPSGEVDTSGDPIFVNFILKP